MLIKYLFIIITICTCTCLCVDAMLACRLCLIHIKTSNKCLQVRWKYDKFIKLYMLLLKFAGRVGACLQHMKEVWWTFQIFPVYNITMGYYDLSKTTRLWKYKHKVTMLLKLLKFSLITCKIFMLMTNRKWHRNTKIKRDVIWKNRLL